MRRCSSLLPLIFVCVAFVMPTVPAFTQGGNTIVKIAPSRLVFEGRTRSQIVSLINSSDQEATYRIALVNVRMSELGRTSIVEEPDEAEQFANRLIRYSPRQVTIPAHGSQTIRITVRKPSDIETGEYRSHMQFSVVPPDVTGQTIEDIPAEEGMLQIRITPLYGVTIPVIVRHGNLDYSMTMSDPAIIQRADDDDNLFLRVTLHREGSRSSYGNIIVAHTAPDRTETIIGQINQLAVYVPNPSRVVTVPLRLPEGLDLSSGSVHVSYHATQAEGGDRLAEVSFEL